MNGIQIATLLVVLAGLFGSVNYFVLRLPSTIGILVVALLASISLMLLDLAIPSITVAEDIRRQVQQIEFSQALLEWMLGLLLFAGALHAKLDAMRRHAVVILLLTTLGVVISTAVAGFGFAWITGIPLLMALIFGAIISPTDPVAVLGVLREAELRPSLEAQIAGESLFNDGAAYVIFLFLVGLAFPAADHVAAGWTGAMLLFAREVFGGLALGAALGWITYLVVHRIDDYPLVVLLSIGLALGGYELAVALGVSGPLTAVVAGLALANIGNRYGMAGETEDYLDKFWEIIDEILNAVLFLLIGVEVFAIAFGAEALVAIVLTIGLSLVARLAAVAVPVALLSPFRSMPGDIIPVMTWGGLKGGVSVALALSLPESEWKPTILTATYVIVVFSIIVQGLSVGRLARMLAKESD